MQTQKSLEITVRTDAEASGQKRCLSRVPEVSGAFKTDLHENDQHPSVTIKETTEQLSKFLLCAVNNYITITNNPPHL